MKTFVYLLDLKHDPGLQRQYLEHHKNCWDCVPKRLTQIGILSDVIYRCGDRLVNIIQTKDNFDPDKDFNAYAKDPECKRWDDMMRVFQQRVPAAREDEWWALCERVYEYSSLKGK